MMGVVVCSPVTLPGKQVRETRKGNAKMKPLQCVGQLRKCITFIPLRKAKTSYATGPFYSGLLLPNVHSALQRLGDHPQRSCFQNTCTLWECEKVQNYLESLSKEHERLTEMLGLPSVREDDRRSVSKRHSELSPLIGLLRDIKETQQEVRELELMCADSREEGQMLALALEEKDILKQNINKLHGKLLQALLPHEKYDMNDAVLEVTSGRTTGGDICQQFTKEVFDMYQNYAYYKSWSFEILNYSPAEYGGLHHAAARISGEGVYKRLKYEGGTHRVQRIPEVGLSSRMQRIHTGTMTVIVLPQPDEVMVKIDSKDLRIDTFRSKGAGGQHVNTTDSAVRIVHMPTGIAVECQQERSQLLNKEKALRILRTKLYEQTVEQELLERRSARKLQVGTRAQSERIRTYNFTQDRLTDHRIHYEVRNLKEFLSGEELLDELLQRLQESADTEAIMELIENYSATQGT
ncbi:peptide chain release factor 1, mitochondrial isoform X2 [Xenopus laevis]|uniref:Peptide chain release factor 1, mitochondrial isoform X2 n=3 Tax=Xenopus laevis TaxID=8355 RepID=A0A8J0UDC7_XENLA|nr:peptide chain release factor 1, mitochondrial isoform X2 [Xenopus laevis]